MKMKMEKKAAEKVGKSKIKIFSGRKSGRVEG